MYPILGRYGPFFLYSFTVVMGLGILAGVGLTAWLARQRPLPHWLDGFLLMLLAGMIGGRIGFVYLRWEYFQQRPSEIWQLWRGGLAYHGALLAGLLALWAWTSWQKRPFSAYAGLFAPALALLSLFGWAACWLEGCAYGRETVLSPLAADLPDEFGVFALRYQTQLLGAGLALLVFILALWLWKRWSPGALFWFTLGALSLGHLLVGLLRGDTAVFLGPARLDVLFDALIVVISPFAAKMAAGG